MKLDCIEGDKGVGFSGGVQREVRLDLVDSPSVGDFVLVHAGYAIQVLDEAEAVKTLTYIDELLADFPEKEGKI
jgi:hydrogenase expression/formation protein HypC